MNTSASDSPPPFKAPRILIYGLDLAAGSPGVSLFSSHLCGYGKPFHAVAPAQFPVSDCIDTRGKDGGGIRCGDLASAPQRAAVSEIPAAPRVFARADFDGRTRRGVEFGHQGARIGIGLAGSHWPAQPGGNIGQSRHVVARLTLYTEAFFEPGDLLEKHGDRRLISFWPRQARRAPAANAAVLAIGSRQSGSLQAMLRERYAGSEAVVAGHGMETLTNSTASRVVRPGDATKFRPARGGPFHVRRIVNASAPG